MKIVIDLQACQSSANGQRGIGRYSMMLARAMAELAQDPGRQHQVHLLLNNAMADTVGSVAQVFEERLNLIVTLFLAEVAFCFSMASLSNRTLL